MYDVIMEKLATIEAKLDRLLESDEKLSKERDELAAHLKDSPFAAILGEING